MYGLTGDAAGNRGTVATQTQVTMVGEAADPLVATILNQPTLLAIFAYPAGVQMVTGAAPAKRLSFFAHNNTVTTNITENGLKLLDAAVEWLLTQ